MTSEIEMEILKEIKEIKTTTKSMDARITSLEETSKIMMNEIIRNSEQHVEIMNELKRNREEHAEIMNELKRNKEEHAEIKNELDEIKRDAREEKEKSEKRYIELNTKIDAAMDLVNGMVKKVAIKAEKNSKRIDRIEDTLGLENMYAI